MFSRTQKSKLKKTLLLIGILLSSSSLDTNHKSRNLSECFENTSKSSIVVRDTVSDGRNLNHLCLPATAIANKWGTAPYIMILPENMILGLYVASEGNDQRSSSIIKSIKSPNLGITWIELPDFLRLENKRQGINVHLGTPHQIFLKDRHEILAAYENHAAINLDDTVQSDRHTKPWRYSISLAKSEDFGISWNAFTEIDETVGISNGLWEPFMYQHSAEGPIQIYYARERYRTETCNIPGLNAQDIVMKESHDNGNTWSNANIILRRGASREGVPSIVELDDGSLLMAFETWADPSCKNPDTRIAIGLAQSMDYGHTWKRLKNALNSLKLTDSALAWPFITKLHDGHVLLKFAVTKKMNNRDDSIIYYIISKNIPRFDQEPIWSAPRVVFEGRQWGYAYEIDRCCVLFTAGGRFGVPPAIKIDALNTK